MSDRRAQLIEFILTAQALDQREAKEQMGQRGWYDENGVRQGGLMAFIRRYWDILHPGTPFVDGWPLWAMAEHLEAVTFGEIQRLLINVPPGFMKSFMVDVFWPAWEWGPMNMPYLRYVAFAYSSHLTERDNLRFLNLVRSPEYQADWGDRVVLGKQGETIVTNNKYGFKFASSVTGVGTGERGDRVILDDPHKVNEGELPRTTTVEWFRTAMSNRLNDPKTSAIVIIMQRVHASDVSGAILDGEFDYVHLCIPNEFDWDRFTLDDGRPFANDVGWYDPRWSEDKEDSDGLLAWPERFDAEDSARMRRIVGPEEYAGQYQQTPQVKGGGIIRREYWNLFEPEDGRTFPPFDLLIASLDSAFVTEKRGEAKISNDPSAMTVWGIYRDENGRRRIMLVNAWRRRLKLNGHMPPKAANESIAAYEQRTRKEWGLVQWTASTCRRFQVDRLLIENKANGKDVNDELLRQYANEKWSIELIEPTKDKVARAHAVQATWTQGLIYYPDRDWADMVISEMADFPRGKFKDLTDSSTQAIKWLRENGLANSDDEELQAERERVKHRPRGKSLAAHYQGQ